MLKEWRKRLLSSARRGATNDVVSLVEGGCPPDALDEQTGETALSISCQLGHIRIVEVLLSAGAKNDPNPGFGETALQAAIGSSQHLCALALLNQAAAISGKDVIAMANYLDRHGKAPLHDAAALNDSEMVNILLAQGSDIHLQDRHAKKLSWTALHHAAKEGALMAMSALLEVCGAEEVIDLPDEAGNCPLHVAVAFNHSEVALLLLQTAADPNPINTSGLSPYNLAAGYGHMDIAEILLKYLPNSGDRAEKRKLKPLATPEVLLQNCLASQNLPRPVIPSIQLREQGPTEVGSAAIRANLEPKNDAAAASPHDEEGANISGMESNRTPPSFSAPSSKLLQKTDEVNGVNATVDETTTTALWIGGKPLLDGEQDVQHPTDGGGEVSTTGTAEAPTNTRAAHHHCRTESEETFSSWQSPMEEFETKDGNWSLFFSPEGYLYFVLNSATQGQHSQWEDPRLEYVAAAANVKEEEEHGDDDVPVEPIDIPTEVLPPECNSIIIPALQPFLLPPPPQSPPGEDKQLKTPVSSPLPPMHNNPKSPKLWAKIECSMGSPTTLQNAVEITG